MTTVNVGEKWMSNTLKVFRVLSRVENDGQVWIHYRDDSGREYSCWEESFVHRFSKDLTTDGPRRS